MLFQQERICDGLVREVQTSPGNQISFMMRVAPKGLIRRRYSHQFAWMTPLTCAVHSMSSLKWQPHPWSADTEPAGPSYTCSQLKENSPNTVPSIIADTLQNTLMPFKKPCWGIKLGKRSFENRSAYMGKWMLRLASEGETFQRHTHSSCHCSSSGQSVSVDAEMASTHQKHF